MTEIYKNTVSLPTKAQINKDTDTVIKKPENEESGSYENAAEIKEIKFFSDPKTVKKKTQGSILTFQIAFSVLFCLFYKLTQLLAPELYHNISTYLERLFGW
ncbi:MAG: hypothetical protein HFE79_04435 [Ruminiclostridium sp.]|jgi:hypothetical protein|nr:hypothetical protein [Ruminiclostridium sp.]